MREIIGLIAAHLTAGQFAALADPGTLTLAAAIDTRGPDDETAIREAAEDHPIVGDSERALG